MWKKNERGIRHCVFFYCILFCISTTAYAQEELGEGWLRFPLRGSSFGPAFGASSVLEAEEGIYHSRYGSDKAQDQDPATAWVEGVPGPGEGESYWLGFDHYPEALGFINGYAKNQELFEKNHRVRSMEVQVFAAVGLSGFAGQWEDYYDARSISEVRMLRLNDSMGPQRVLLPFDMAEVVSRMKGFQESPAIKTRNFPQAKEMGLDGTENISQSFLYIIRLQISTTYPGTKWEDTCIAELWPDYGQVVDVNLSADGQHLSIVDIAGRRIPVFYDFDYVLTLLEVSEDKRWALVIKEPSHTGSGRVSSEYGIVYLPAGRELTENIPGPESYKLLPYSFYDNE